MKQSKKVFLALLTLLCLLTSLMPVSGFAAPREYTVRFYGGNIGTINGTATVTAAAGDPVTVPGVTAKSGYYFKGFIESGKNWRNNLLPYDKIELFASKEEANKKYDFYDIDSLDI